MFKIDFYENKKGESEIIDFISDLENKSKTSKNARIQLKQIMHCINNLEKRGNQLDISLAKHLVDDIWELRPGNNRVIYFFFQNNTFVLLHAFRKKTQKTPRREIKKAINERNDYISRHTIDRGDKK